MVACCKRCLPIGFWLVVSLYWDDDPQIAMIVWEREQFSRWLLVNIFIFGQLSRDQQVFTEDKGVSEYIGVCLAVEWVAVVVVGVGGGASRGLASAFDWIYTFSHVFLQITNWWMFLIFAWQLHPAVRACINMFALLSYPPFPSCWNNE
jgi:hypothetical protein